MRQEQRIALVTGAGGDLGRSIALRLAARGLVVLLNGRNRSTLEETATLIAEAGGRSQVMVADVGDAGQVTAMMERLGQEGGRLDVLVNNAGINRDGPFHTMSYLDWEAVLRTNLTGPFLVTQAALPYLQQSPAASIVNITARTAQRARKNGANYCSAKAGLEMLTRCLALELSPHIRVNAVAPGATDTAEVRERYQLHDAKRWEEYVQAIPLRRVSTSDDMARLVIFVALDATFMTGETIVNDGGRNLS